MNMLNHRIKTPLRHLRGWFAGNPSAPSATLPVAPLATPSLRRISAQGRPAPARDLLQIACPDPTAEDQLRDRHQSRARHLVRQERWHDLSALIREADRTRRLTPGALAVADLMAYGARADVVLAAEHALLAGSPEPGAPLQAGIEALEHVLSEHRDDYVVTCIVAQSHMDVAWAWRGTGWDVEVPISNREAFEAHFDRAAQIMQAPCVSDLQTPLIATTACALLGGTDAGRRGVADRYGALIDLNPANPRPMRAMGNHLLPRWHGSYEELDCAARRTAARCAHVWGAGGYTWVQFDAISRDDRACANLDLAFFIEGLRDILKRRPDPYTANLLAAYCGNAIGQSFSGDDRADHVRSQIAECTGWIVRDHLTELHPMIWAHAARGFDSNLRIHSPNRFAAAGREDALRIITALFKREIAAGQRIVFTGSGATALAA
ncbi:hypothetical protein ACFSUD_03110 [Sulfitobacter aestuarii]|uniref:Uncharacterized protein n=1 Tax=Sulfitobacter aestuarii TaxID=2161676 RepID=A0ABW5TYI9_9RHOB